MISKTSRFLKGPFAREKQYLLAILILFAIIFSLISLVNHYNFRTYAWDLGNRNNAIYDYTQFQWNECTLMYPDKKFENILGDHFCIIPVIVSPLRYIFGTYTMLVVQILGLLWGATGIFYLITYLSKKALWGRIAAAHFLSMFAIYSALGFDYHDNVMAAVFVPWLFYFVHKNQWLYSVIYLTLILISKENMALWAFFILAGMLILYWKDAGKRIPLSVGAIISIAYFMLIVGWAMPAIGDGQDYQHFAFAALGGNFSEALETIFTRPKYVFSLLFENHLDDAGKHAVYYGIKSELHFFVLLAGGIALFIKPQFLLMLLPVYGQKLFNNDIVKWGIGYHYSIEFVPIITIALFWWLLQMNNQKKAGRLVWIFLVLNILATASSLDKRTSKWFSPTQVRFYQSKHYERDFDVAQVHELLKHIPDDAKLSAQTMLVPHVSFRETIYNFPYIADADYIAILPGTKNTYPLNRNDYNNKIKELINSGKWKKEIEEGAFLLLKKVGD